MPKKTKTSKKQAKKGSSTPTPAVNEEALSPSRARAVLEELRPRYPTMTAVMQGAFESLATDAQCAELGTKTRASGVLNEGVRWAVTMDEALRKEPASLTGYSPKRFAFFLHTLSVLADGIGAHEKSQQTKGKARTAASAAHDAASEARGGLVSKMTTFAGARAPEMEALRSAAGRVDNDDSLAASLTRLGGLTKQWLGRGDSASVILAESAGLNQADVQEAHDRAKALIQAAGGAALTTGGLRNDSPVVNAAEGRVLVEMREAKRLFGEANERNRRVPKLVPGPATRHVLARRPAAQEEGGDAAGDEAEGGEDASPT